MSGEEFSKSLKAALYNRSKSPFYGTFIITWLVWNWRPLYYLFGEEENQKLAEKLAYINEHYVNICTNLWYPLLYSTIVFLAGNVLTIGFRFLQIKFSNFQKEHIEKYEMLSQEETQKARKELIDYETRINTSSLDLKRQIEGLEAELVKKEKEIKSLKIFEKKIDLPIKTEDIIGKQKSNIPAEELEKIKHVLDIDNIEMLEIVYYVYKNNRKISMGALERKTSFDKSKIEYYLRQLDDIIFQEDNEVIMLSDCYNKLVQVLKSTD